MSYAFEVTSEFSGGSNHDESAIVPGSNSLISRDDAAYFLESTFGIDLDEFQEDAIYSELPQLNILVDDRVTANHPHLDNTPGRDAIPHLHRPPPGRLHQAARQALDFSAITDVATLEQVMSALAPYTVRIWQTHGDLAFVLARDHNNFRMPRGIQQDFRMPAAHGGKKMRTPDWHQVVASTAEWTERKEAGEKNGDEFVPFRKSSEASPYLTPSETGNM